MLGSFLAIIHFLVVVLLLIAFFFVHGCQRIVDKVSQFDKLIILGPVSLAICAVLLCVQGFELSEELCCFLFLFKVQVNVGQVDKTLACLQILLTLELLHQIVRCLTVFEALGEVVRFLEVSSDLRVDAHLRQFLLFLLEDLCVTITCFLVVSCLSVERCNCSIYVLRVLTAIAAGSEHLLVELNRFFNLAIAG